jgi:hypothetical protein
LQDGAECRRKPQLVPCLNLRDKKGKKKENKKKKKSEPQLVLGLRLHVAQGIIHN